MFKELDINIAYETKESPQNLLGNPKDKSERLSKNPEYESLKNIMA